MKFFLFLLLSLPVFAEIQFSSPYVQKIHFKVDDGVVYSSNTQDVYAQLKYLFGILNEVDAGVDFPHLKIEILSVVGNEIRYKVSGDIAWSKSRPLPRSLVFLLPKYADEPGLTVFLNKYQKTCARKASVLASFWNYYRPHKEGCVIDDEDVVQVSAELNSAPSTNETLVPDYTSIFADGKLEMTVIMTKDKPLDVNDVSIYDLSQLCGNLVEVECHRQMNERTLLHVYLLNNFDDGPQAFLSKLEKILSISDVISYNGHSGMGANIESWMKYYPVKDKEKYQIFFFNSCDTYGYFRNEFLTENRQVILNATPNYFGTFAYSNLSLMKGLVQQHSFYEILQSLPAIQGPLLLN